MEGMNMEGGEYGGVNMEGVNIGALQMDASPSPEVCIRGQTVHRWAVRILLECILVSITCKHELYPTNVLLKHMELFEQCKA